MYRIDVWVKPYGCFYPGINTYKTLEEANKRAKEMRRAKHRVKVVLADAPKYTEN